MGVLTRISGGGKQEKTTPRGKLTFKPNPTGKALPKDERTTLIQKPAEVKKTANKSAVRKTSR